jgi:hypothetical protein
MARRPRLPFVISLLLPALLPAGGCVQRTMTITSDPPGALVFMNDQELGRTPMKKDFIWYGTYDVQLRKEGYVTATTKQAVIAPIWQWPPIDLLAEFWPGRLKDERHFNYTLIPASTQPSNPDMMLARGEELRKMLESSKYTKPTTAPSSQPAK